MKILGVLLILAGIILGFYLGLWVMFIGGIVTLVSQIPELGNGNVDGITIGIGILRIMFSTLVGVIGGVIPIGIGRGLLDVETKKEINDKFKLGGRWNEI